MKPEEICIRLSSLTGIELPCQTGSGDPFAVVPPGQWKQVCLVARDDLHLSFNFLRSLCGVDRPQDNAIEVVIHLFSYRYRHAITLKTRVDRTDGALATLPSLGELWPAAIFHERETYDLLGVHFTGHPDLRRILLPEDWVGHPLRKDYREAASYHGIPTQRPGYGDSTGGGAT